MQAIPLPDQFIHLLASVVLLLSFAMLAQLDNHPAPRHVEPQRGPPFPDRGRPRI